jgi:hypothetical protein
MADTEFAVTSPNVRLAQMPRRASQTVYPNQVDAVPSFAGDDPAARSSLIRAIKILHDETGDLTHPVFGFGIDPGVAHGEE